ncbi:MAG TPA: radical SAM protein [bacterium]|nr:radical SAM protein [bacterium]
MEYPIYLAYLVAIVRGEGYDVEFIDAVLEELSIADFAGRAGAAAPDMVVLECSTPSIDYDLRTAAAVKAAAPAAMDLIGSHPTVFHREIMEENPEVDVVCRGEYDFTVRDLARARAGGKGLEEIEGITWRSPRGVRVNPERPLIAGLDEIPFPARDLVASKYYRQGTFRGKTPTTVVTSRGCPFGCTYCLWPRTLYGRTFRARSAGNVVDELEECVRRYGIDEVYFDDDSMALDRERMLKICSLIVERGLRFEWIAQCRVSSMDEEVLRAMKRAGCRYIRFGVESGSPKMLRLMKKGITTEQVVRAFALARKVGIRTQAFFLFGVPGENAETIEETIRFAKRLPADSAQFAVVIPHPGTELYASARAAGSLKYTSWEDFSSCRGMIETPELSLDQVEAARIRAYKEFYFRPSFLLRTLVGIHSLDDLKSVLASARSIVSRIGFFRRD